MIVEYFSVLVAHFAFALVAFAPVVVACAAVAEFARYKAGK